MSGSDFWRAFATPFFLMVFFVLAFFSVYKLGINKPVSTPTVSITSGTEVVTAESTVPVTGKVSNTKIVTVNGTATTVSEDGSFTASVPVALGQNSIEVIAGEGKQAKAVVVVTREIAKQETSSTSASIVATAGADLSASGPAENVFGSLGLAALLVSFMVLRQSRLQNAFQKSQFTP